MAADAFVRSYKPGDDVQWRARSLAAKFGMKVLGLCGSLRAQSRTLVLLNALARRAPSGHAFTMADSIGALPLFNPDIASQPTAAVSRLFDQVTACSAIVVSSPEYARGVTGVIKNALDWLVGFEPFATKPLALLNPSDRAFHADASLREILVTMNADLIVPACVRVCVTSTDLTAAEIAELEPYSSQIQWVWRQIIQHCAMR